MDISDKGLGVGLFVGLVLGVLGSAGEGGLVVEAVKVAASLLELLDPFLRLYPQRKLLFLLVPVFVKQCLPLQSSYDNQRCPGRGPQWADRHGLGWPQRREGRR